MNTSNQYLQILRDCLALAQLPDRAEDIVAGAPFHLGETAFTLQADDAGELVTVQAELGSPPEGREREVYELLLHSNLLLAGSFGPVFALRVDQPVLLMVLTLPVSALTPEGLHQSLERAAEAATVWRVTQGFTPSADPAPRRVAAHPRQSFAGSLVSR
ncbi:CesT family type III secretion system chaperone [Caldimonas brevitalea]|uniref:Type III secretion system chaperone n=1 Tax=Caldimonas brevitalea TaxID=413882 RepID=A0A0G3BJH8_9BURK|nr:CesT family type III secretion system chaperone [Caldimonas brevitalea]AKJ27531.1 hypothetical protein AAW51_0840 [Caldimonas brevitalea]